MALSYVGASAVTVGNGVIPAAVTPNASTAVGDLVIWYFFGKIGTLGTQGVNIPTGFTQIIKSITANGALVAAWRIRQAGDTTYQGTLSGTWSTATPSGDVIQTFTETYRGHNPTTPIKAVGAASTWASSLSAGPITAPTSAAMEVGDMAVIVAGKEENTTAQTLLTGDSLTWSAGVMFDTTTGADQSVMTQHGLATVATTLTSKTIVTTGTAATGTGVSLILAAPVALSATATDVVTTISDSATALVNLTQPRPISDSVVISDSAGPNILPTSAFYDDFNDPVASASKWAKSSLSAYTNNQVQITPSTGYPGLYAQGPRGIGGNGTWDLRESAVIVQFDPSNLVKASVANSQFGVSSSVTLNLNYTITHVTDSAGGNGTLYFESHSTGNGGVNTSTSLPYDPAAHAWWRIRESGGTIFWDTSPDGHTWTNRKTLAEPFVPSLVYLYLQSGLNATFASPGYAIYDNFNVVPPILGSAIDTVIIGDSAARASTNSLRSGPDSVAISDGAIRNATRTRTSTESVVISDQSRIGVGPRDTWTVSDSAIRTAPRTRSTSEPAIPVSDSASRALLSRARSAADSVYVPGDELINWLVNPSFEGDGIGSLPFDALRSSDGTSTYIDSAVRAHTSGVGHGTQAYHLQTNAIRANGYVDILESFNTANSPSVAPGEVWTLLADVDVIALSGTSNLQVGLGATNSGGGWLGQNLIQTTTIGSQRLIATFTMPAGAAKTYAAISLGGGVSGGAGEVYLNSWMLLKGDFSSNPPAYFDGSTGPGTRWNGTPNRSASSKSMVLSSVGRNGTGSDTILVSDTAKVPIYQTGSDTVIVSDSAAGVLNAPIYGGGSYGSGTYGDPYASTIHAYTATASDTVSISDVATISAIHPRTTGDTWTVNDVATRTATRTRITGDSVVLSDVATRTAPRTRSAADGVTLSDLATRSTLRTASATDSWAISDSTARVPSNLRSATDGYIVSDLAVRSTLRARTSVDSWAITDATTRANGRSRSGIDSLVASDTATRNATVRTRATSDLIVFTDAAIPVTTRARAAIDSFAVSDTISRSGQSAPRSSVDAFAVSDVAVKGAGQPKTANDTFSISDSAVRSPYGRTRSASDNIAILDSSGRIRAGNRTSIDTIVFSDIAQRTLVRTRTSSDSVALTDSGSTGQTKGRSASDNIVIVDASGRTLIEHRTSGEIVAITDSAQRVSARTRTAHDTVLVVDSSGDLVGRVRSAADSFSVSDGSVRHDVGGRNASDTITLSDHPEVLTHRFVYTVDIVSVIDEALRAITIERITVDTVSVIDQVSDVGTYGTIGFDSFAVGDSAASKTALQASASDIVVISDRAGQKAEHLSSGYLSIITNESYSNNIIFEDKTIETDLVAWQNALQGKTLFLATDQPPDYEIDTYSLFRKTLSLDVALPDDDPDTLTVESNKLFV